MRSTWPLLISFRVFLVRRIGNGQFSPRASTSRSNGAIASITRARFASVYDRQPGARPAADAAAKVVNALKATLVQQGASLRRASARLTHQNHRSARIERVDVGRQRTQLDVLCTGDRAARELARGPDVDQLRPLIAFEERFQLRGIESLDHEGTLAEKRL